MQEIYNMNYLQLKTYYRLFENKNYVHESRIVKAICNIHGTEYVVDMCPECFKLKHHEKQQDAHRLYSDGSYMNTSLDCKTVFYRIDEDGKLTTVGQCCCYCSAHGVRNE